MEDHLTSPVKNKATSRVIDSLHSQIDGLKTELETVKMSHDEYKKKFEMLSKKNDLFVDQLANAKHENDMVNALLRRKERRIVDLEDQYNELSLDNETVRLSFKNMKIRCENLQENSASLTAEYERLKIAYDALIASQQEYKRHYSLEINTLTNRFDTYKKEQEEKLAKLSDQFCSNDKDVETLLDSLTNKKRAMETLYVNKNKHVLDLLVKLSKVAKLHGQESKQVLAESIETVELLVAKHPDLAEKIKEHENVDIDLSEILQELNEMANSSFDEEATLINSPELASEPKMKQQQQPQQQQQQQQTQPSNNQANRRRKNKRNSMRVDSNNSNMPDFSHINTPTGQPQLNLPKRNFNSGPHKSGGFNDSRQRTPTPPPSQQQLNPQRRNNSNNSNNGGHNNGNGNNSNNNSNNNNNVNGNNNNNKSKRRSMYGANNNANNNGGYNGNYRGNRQSFHELQPVNY